MKRLIAAMAIIVTALALAGCAGAGGKTTTTTVRIDPETGKEVKTMVENEASFWKSENQQMHYDYENNRVDKSAQVALKKIESMDLAAARRAEAGLSPEARAYADAFDMYVRAQIQPAIPASGMPTPKNMADVVGPNMVALATLGVGVIGAAFDLDIGGPFGKNSGEGSTSLEEVTIAGDFYNNSVRQDSYSLSDSASFAPTSSPSLSWTYTNTEGNQYTQGSESPTTMSNPVESGVSLF